MNIENFLGIAIVGVIFSLAVQFIKNKFGTSSNGTKLITVSLAVVIAGIYVWIQSTPYFETVITVLGVASTIYAFFLKE